MRPTERRRLGRTGVELSALGLGGGPLGELFVRVSEADAQATLEAAWTAGVRYFDTAPWYGRGLSEHRVGRFLRGVRRGEAVVSTKVGRVLRRPRDPGRFDTAPWAGGLRFEVVFDYGYDAILRSYEDSLQRLGLERVDVLLVHDLDVRHHGDELGRHVAQLTTGAGWRALEELRAAGEVRALGFGINELGLIPRFLDLVDVDVFLVAMRYTLLDQRTLDEELPRCAERGVGIVVGAVFNSGILATGAVPGAKYDYAGAPPKVLAKVERIDAVCRRHGVPLPAAALQFPLAHESVAAVIPGAIAPEQVDANVLALEQPIPPAFWVELKAEGLLLSDAPVPVG